MSRSGGVNKVILAGKVLENPYRAELNGMQWIFLRLLTSEKLRSIKGEFEQHEVHKIRLCENSPSLNWTSIKKGDVLYIQGKAQTRIHIDDNGIKRYETEVVAGLVECLSFPAAGIEETLHV